MTTPEQIIIKSNEVQIVGESGPIFLNTNKEIHLGATGRILFDVGPVGSKNPQNKFLVNSPRVEFGIPNDNAPLLKLESVAKSDQLILILNEMLQILEDSVTSPDQNRTKGDIENLKQQMYKIKSQTTYTI
jgi:hypothetical protein